MTIIYEEPEHNLQALSELILMILEDIFKPS